MKVRLGWVVLLMALLCASLSAGSAAVGTVTVQVNLAASGVTQYTVRWTSSAGGAVSANPFTIKGGHIQAVKFVPGSGGTQPSDLYDATVVDADGIDILDAQGANLSNAAGAYVQFTTPFYYPGRTLDLVIANAGNAKTGTVTIWTK